VKGKRGFDEEIRKQEHVHLNVYLNVFIYWNQ